MKLVIVAVGQKMPDWAQTAFDDYAKRFPPELRLECRTVKTEPRTGGKTAAQMMQAEMQRIEAAIDGGTHKGRRVVVLDERGTALTTRALAERLHGWQQDTVDQFQRTFVRRGGTSLDAGIQIGSQTLFLSQ